MTSTFVRIDSLCLTVVSAKNASYIVTMLFSASSQVKFFVKPYIHITINKIKIYIHMVWNKTKTKPEFKSSTFDVAVLRNNWSFGLRSYIKGLLYSLLQKWEYSWQNPRQYVSFVWYKLYINPPEFWLHTLNILFII